MTKEQLVRGKEISVLLDYAKAELDTVNTWFEKINQPTWYGLRIPQGELCNTRIRPNEAEMRAMLTMMKDRLETKINNLNKEFEEL